MMNPTTYLFLFYPSIMLARNNIIILKKKYSNFIVKIAERKLAYKKYKTLIFFIRSINIYELTDYNFILKNTVLNYKLQFYFTLRIKDFINKRQLLLKNYKSKVLIAYKSVVLIPHKKHYCNYYIELLPVISYLLNKCNFKKTKTIFFFLKFIKRNSNYPNRYLINKFINLKVKYLLNKTLLSHTCRINLLNLIKKIKNKKINFLFSLTNTKTKISVQYNRHITFPINPLQINRNLYVINKYLKKKKRSIFYGAYEESIPIVEPFRMMPKKLNTTHIRNKHKKHKVKLILPKRLVSI